MNSRIEHLQSVLAPVREEIVNHPLYGALSDINGLNAFMGCHVFAVWDFMSLLKSLQRHLTCVEVPWIPVGSPETRYLINEIVIGEESDVDQNGNRMSHFELYLSAMRQSGADTSSIENLLLQVKSGKNILSLISEMAVDDGIKNFLRFTFDIAGSGKPHLIASVFTFGREDLIPGMFMSMVDELNNLNAGAFSTFKYYLERHIEVDGDHHSHLAMQMVNELCGDDDVLWREAEEAAAESLRMRKGLWDAALNAVNSTQQVLQFSK
jgi:hypothetical protein